MSLQQQSLRLSGLLPPSIAPRGFCRTWALAVSMRKFAIVLTFWSLYCVRRFKLHGRIILHPNLFLQMTRC